MPTSGTHITIVQRLALISPLEQLLGNPDTDPTSPAYDPDGLIRMKFACLGAVGPDIFYALADYGADLQDYENFLIKVGGSFECMSNLMEEIGRYVDGVLSTITLGVTDSLSQTSNLIVGVIKDSLLALVVKAGANFWPFFEPKRQQDRPQEEWYWADFLHYIRSGRFVRALLEDSKRRLESDPNKTQYQNLYAYALGYLTHYIVDIVGHPYVNQVVQSPWRMYWQRHHLVENFIDAYIWDRWHTQLPPFPPPTAQEQPLDKIVKRPNAIGSGAPFSFARLHDYIAIGIPTLGDPVDILVGKVCDKIKQGLFDLSIAEETESPEPADTDFQAWTQMIADTIQSVYNNTRRHPKNLEKSELGLAGGPRPNGYPLPQDIGAAYGTFRLLLKLITEEKITEPKAPTIAADISQAIQKLKNDLLENLERLVKPPQPRLSGKPNLHELWNAIKNTAMWMAEVAEQVVKTVFDFVRDVINTSGTAVADSIKYALYLLNKALFALYRSVRDILVLAADVVPFTQDLAVERGNLFNTRSLWCSPGDLGINSYPLEEFVIHVDGRLAMPQREFAHNPIASYPPYAPFIPPTTLGASVEQPPVDLTAPYRPASGTTFARPDAFIDGARGDDMFAQSGPQRPAHSTDPKAPNTFAADRRNFGGAMANCEWALLHWSDSSFVLPDYNLDSDRGYAWPCWDTEGQIASDAPPNQADPIYDRAVPDPLDPTDHRNPGVAHVNATMAN